MMFIGAVVKRTILALALLLLTRPAEGQVVGASRCSTGVHESESTGTVWLPQDQIFCPLLADPKEPRSFVSYLRGEFRTLDDPSGVDTHIGSVGLGDSIGVIRWNSSRPGNGVQFDVAGAVFAQFDLGSASSDLINADYIFALPLTIRHGGFSSRIKLYHQSSHLGDEFLLRDQEIQRENLSFESIELLLSQEVGPLRLYGGTERIFSRQPRTLAEQLVHGGLELRRGSAGPLRLVAAADLKATEQHDWSPASSVRLGLEVAKSSESDHPSRLIALMLELYEGPSPYGQFFQDDIQYLGVGFHIGF
jgi:hypothetical protein